MSFSLKMNKKGASVWISWILLFAFAIALSTAGFRFIVPTVEKSTVDLKKVVFNTDECRQVGLSIESACQSNSTQDLNITIRNRNSVRVDKLLIQAYDEGNKPLLSNSTTTLLGANRVKVYSVNLNTSSRVGYIVVTPTIFREDLEIVCEQREATETTIPDC